MSIDIIANELIIPAAFLLFVLAILCFVLCYCIKSLIDNVDRKERERVRKAKERNKEMENRLSALEVKLNHVEVKPVGYDDFIS